MIKYFILAIFTVIVGCSTNKPKEYLVPKRAVFRNDQKTISKFIGKWESVYSSANKKNIQKLELNSDGIAKIIIDYNGTKNEYIGEFSVTRYKRIELKSAIKVTTKENETILLSNVYFGAHCGVSISEGYEFLRIDDEPHGVLKKIN
jgi:hypothetical protein